MSRRTLAIIIAVAAVVAFGVDLVSDYSPFPGYAVLIGFLGCVGIIIVSKWLGKVWLQRPADYYEPAAEPADGEGGEHG